MKKVLSLILGLILALPAAAEPGPKYLALTFDDGPSGAYTERLLKGLSDREAEATFFLCGYRVDLYPELAAEIARQGHEIGVHGDEHRHFTEMSPEEVRADLSAAREKITAAAGQSPTVLRPPGGLYDMDVLEASCCADLPVILWSIDPEDWHRSDAPQMAEEIISRAESGDILLLHDMSSSSVETAFLVMDALEDLGFRFVTVSELAFLSRTEFTGGRAYHRFSFEKNAAISFLDACTEPCAKPGFPPPRPRSSRLRSRTRGRRSPSSVPRA